MIASARPTPFKNCSWVPHGKRASGRGAGHAPFDHCLGAPPTSPGPFQSWRDEAQFPDANLVGNPSTGVPGGQKYHRTVVSMSESTKKRMFVS
jgi:hypothetical protein